MNHLIQNDTVVQKSEKKLRSFIGEYVESSENWAVGSKCVIDQETKEAAFSEAILVNTNKEIAVLRELAYSHVHTGTKKYFEEAAAKRAMDDEAGALEAEARGLARRAEIQAEYPFNED